MTKFGLAKAAASTIAVASLFVVANPATGERQRDAVAEAAKHAASAVTASRKRKHQDAVAEAEAAVALMPNEPRYRSLLAQTYLSAGRFGSAETAYSDVIRLSPSDRTAAISLTLAQLALGKRDAALETLTTNAEQIGASDRGLALALAGDPQAGVAVLEQAARDAGGDARTRQNLALAYAMAGRWMEAKIMARYDVAPQDVPRRMGEWAMFVQAANPMQQVSTLLGVTPAQDPGQPAALALAPPMAAPVALAAVAPPPPVALPAEAFQAPKVDLSEYAGVRLADAGDVVQPLPVEAKPVAWPVVPAAKPLVSRKPAPAARLIPANLVLQGRFVVQLGAYSAPERTELAWDGAVKRFAGLEEFTPTSTTFVPSPGARTLYRLSLSGFATRTDAVRVCETLKSRGGACFVRATAGDATPQWALRRKGQQLAAR